MITHARGRAIHESRCRGRSASALGPQRTRVSCGGTREGCADYADRDGRDGGIMSKSWIAVAVVMLLANVSTAAAAAKAGPQIDAAPSHLRAARTLIEQSMADEPPNDYAKTTAAQNL